MAAFIFCLILLTLVAICTVMSLRFGIAADIITCNFLYNACPKLLQQFNTEGVLKVEIKRRNSSVGYVNVR